MQPHREFENTDRLKSAVDPSRWRVVTMLVVCLVSGCAGGKVYKVGELPSDLHARPTSNVRTVGLTKLAIDPKPNDEVGPGDVIEVGITSGLSSEETVTFPVRVNNDGYAELVYIEPVYLGGLTLEECESVVKNAYIRGNVFREPHVAVTMKQRKAVQFTIVGAVENEGQYTLSAGSAGLLNAISVAGGFSKDAGTIVEIRYPNRNQPNRPQGVVAQAGGPHQTMPQIQPAGASHSLVGHRVPVQTSGSRTVKVDLATYGEGDSSSLTLQDGAVVMVERRDPLPLKVQGLVHKPDVYEFPVGKDIRLLQAIAMAGGESSFVADKVHVIRQRPEMPEPVVVELSLKQAKLNGAEENILLEPGDTVIVEQTPATTFMKAIELVGFNLTGRAF